VVIAPPIRQEELDSGVRGEDVGTETYATPTSTGSGIAAVPAARAGSGTLTAPAPATAPISWINRPLTPARAGADPGAQPEPRLRQLMGVCGWAAVLGGIGLVIGIRGFVGVLMDEPPGWYEPAAVVTGLIGILLTVGAFATVNLRRVPWLMLGGSSVVLVIAMVLTTAAF
jgi:hypothetical protein